MIEVRTSGINRHTKANNHNKTAMVRSASMTGSFLDLREGQTALLYLDTVYIAGMMMVVRPWFTGLTC
ncbi:MAG: hypothetical protein IPH20_19140 [Bacteroidales bacterium]|nr:hypothetical protein [Bacteroidales bacterium]